MLVAVLICPPKLYLTLLSILFDLTVVEEGRQEQMQRMMGNGHLGYFFFFFIFSTTAVPVILTWRKYGKCNGHLKSKLPQGQCGKSRISCGKQIYSGGQEEKERAHVRKQP